MKLPKIIGGLLVTVLLIGAAGATIAYAQDGTTTPTPPTNGPTDGRGPGHGHGFLGQVELQAAADALGMTTDELSTALQSGKTLQDLADAAGVDLQVVQDAINKAHAEEVRQRIQQALSDGTISQEKADWLLEGLDKGFLDGPGFGFGFGHHGPDGVPPQNQTAPATPTP